MPRTLAALAISLIAAVPALAATPENGTVSLAAPEVKWEGTSNAGFITTFSQIIINGQGEKQPCHAPSCDTFTLEVKDQADLNVEVESAASMTYLQVEKPDGTVVYNTGLEPEGTEPDYVTKLKIKKAPAGKYLVQAATNSFLPVDYTGRAYLGVPPAPVTPPPASEPQPQPGAPAPAPSRSTPAPATISVKAGKLSARKLAKSRKLPLTLSSTEPVKNVKVLLAFKGRKVATGALATLSGTQKLSLKMRRKLKPGRYDLVVEADGASGTKTTLKVRR